MLEFSPSGGKGAYSPFHNPLGSAGVPANEAPTCARAQVEGRLEGAQVIQGDHYDRNAFRKESDRNTTKLVQEFNQRPRMKEHGLPLEERVIEHHITA